MGKLLGAELKIAKRKLALSGRSLAHIRACGLELALFMTRVDLNQFLAVEARNLALFSTVRMKAGISLYH